MKSKTPNKSVVATADNVPSSLRSRRQTSAVPHFKRWPIMKMSVLFLSAAILSGCAKDEDTSYSGQESDIRFSYEDSFGDDIEVWIERDSSGKLQARANLIRDWSQHLQDGRRHRTLFTRPFPEALLREIFEGMEGENFLRTAEQIGRVEMLDGWVVSLSRTIGPRELTYRFNTLDHLSETKEQQVVLDLIHLIIETLEIQDYCPKLSPRTEANKPVETTQAVARPARLT